jgi:CDP-diacylglycerol--glycerol-3-phosphate 3-phosphatidyltransferase
MNMPNKLTLTRIVLTPIFMSFFVVDLPWCKILGFFLFIVAALTDLADGHYARKYGIITGFGKFMDPLADKILVSAALIALVAIGYARAWMAMIIIAREFYVTGIRSLAAYKGTLITASTIAKIKTASQMIAITFIFIVITLEAIFCLYDSPAQSILNFDRQLVFDIILGAATVLTVYSGVDYTVKYYSMLRNALR